MKIFQILILSLLLFSCHKLESVDIKEKADSPLNEYCIGVDVAEVRTYDSRGNQVEDTFN